MRLYRIHLRVIPLGGKKWGLGVRINSLPYPSLDKTHNSPPLQGLPGTDMQEATGEHMGFLLGQGNVSGAGSTLPNQSQGSGSSEGTTVSETEEKGQRERVGQAPDVNEPEPFNDPGFREEEVK